MVEIIYFFGKLLDEGVGLSLALLSGVSKEETGLHLSSSPKLELKSRVSAAFATTAEGFFGPYDVEELTSGGAIFMGRFFPGSEQVQGVLLMVEGHGPVQIPARVVFSANREDGDSIRIMEFEHPKFSGDQEEELAMTHSIPTRSTEQQDSVVLVVDDFIEVCHAIERDLKKVGRRSVYATTSHEAIMLLLDPDIHIDAAVVDLFLGTANGLELLEFLMKRHPDIRRVLISGQARDLQLRLALESGQAHAIMQKPWKRADLTEALAMKDLSEVSAEDEATPP